MCIFQSEQLIKLKTYIMVFSFENIVMYIIDIYHWYFCAYLCSHVPNTWR